MLRKQVKVLTLSSSINISSAPKLNSSIGNINQNLKDLLQTMMNQLITATNVVVDFMTKLDQDRVQ